MLLRIHETISVFLLVLVSVDAQVATKAVVHYCDPDSTDSCGPDGFCEIKRSGNRCQCPVGWMGPGCERPCQDVYKSCAKWREEERCSWTRPILPFFGDNCPLSCGVCRGNGKQLTFALPPILEPISWMVGRWEAHTLAGERYPVPMHGGYREVLEVQLAEVPQFDRPPVNISVTATSLDGRDTYREVGFMTGKPFNEDTGFVEFNKPAEGDDKVGIELVSSTGMITIEEGIVKGTTIRLETKYKKSIQGSWQEFKQSKRLFRLLDANVLEERVIYTDSRGISKKWLKRFIRTRDYLHELVDAPPPKPPRQG